MTQLQLARKSILGIMHQTVAASDRLSPSSPLDPRRFFTTTNLIQKPFRVWPNWSAIWKKTIFRPVQADQDEQYAREKLADIFHYLEPASMSVQVGGRLIKLDRHQMKFSLLNFMIALFYRVLPEKILDRGSAFTTQEFVDAVQHIPHSVLPERRKQRAYLSSVLAKNEIDKEDRHNRQLFLRLKRGAYLFNPKLALKIGEEWVNIHDLLSLDKPAHRRLE